MMKLSHLLLALCFSACAIFAEPGFDAVAFSPDQWPGKAPVDVQRALRGISAEATEAMRVRDLPKLASIREKYITALGVYAGVPEERPVYGMPLDPGKPDAQKIAQLWADNITRAKGRCGWDYARKLETSPGAGGKVPRLRVSERQIRALLQTHEAGLDPTGDDLKLAVTGLDYLLSTQAANGVFGYPYEPGGPGLRKQMAEWVAYGEKQGMKMVERDWVVEEFGDDDLKFDNGVCGAVLLHGYALTGDKRYLESAVRAGNWAKSRPLVLNFNYNGFSGVLFARLYRVTGDRAWLDAAKDTFEFGVMSGQMPNGRWFDQHNAKIQYHSVLCWQAAEYLLALREAKDASAARVEKQLRLALGNLATEITTCGTNNAQEALSLSALCFGVMILEPDPSWTKAINVAENYVAGPFADLLR